MSGTRLGGERIEYESDDSHDLLKPREDSLGKLRKENFSLKLRINLLEEFVRSFPEDRVSRSEIDLQKKIIELEIGSMSLKRELGEKQKLLAEAATAIDLIEKSYAEKLAEMAKQNQLLTEKAAENKIASISPGNRSEKGASVQDLAHHQEEQHVRKDTESTPKTKLTRDLCAQVDRDMLSVEVEPKIRTPSSSTCGVNKQHPEISTPKEHRQLREEYKKGCVAIQRLISCVKDLSSENLALKREANSAKMLYLHESRIRRTGNGDNGSSDEDERRTRKSIKKEENQFWWSVVTELVTNSVVSPYS